MGEEWKEAGAKCRVKNNVIIIPRYLSITINTSITLPNVNLFHSCFDFKSVDRSPTMVHDSLPSVTLAALAKTSVSTLSKEKPFMI